MGTRGPRKKVAVAPPSAKENVLLMRCPAWLDTRGKQIWNQLLPRLAKTGVLRMVDRYALGMLCNSLSNLERYKNELRKTGETYMTPKGELRRHPLVMVHRQEEVFAMKILREFGMTPNAGQLIDAIPEPADSEPKAGKIHYFRKP